MIDKESFKFKRVVLTAIIGTFSSIVGTLISFNLSNQTPWLEYEVLPVSYPKKDSIQLSVVNIKILNSGKKECEDVLASIGFGTKTNFTDYSVKKSSVSIPINQKFDSTTGRIVYSISYLNPDEQILFSFSFHKIISEKDIKVDLRSRGLDGVKSGSFDNSLANVFIFGTFCIFILTIFIIFIFLFHQRKIIKFSYESAKAKDAQINILRKELEEKSK